MIRDVLATLVLAASLAVFVVGVQAPRTRRLAMIGLALAGSALGGLAWGIFGDAAPHLRGLGAGLTAITAGLAHGVGFSLVPLPAGRSSWRFVLVPIGMWCGTFASIWFFFGYAGVEFLIPMSVLAAATLAAWAWLPFLVRRREHVRVGTKDVPCVRFACPRCGTRVDWARGVASCTDCGLFVRSDWPAPTEAHDTAPADPPRSVKFACPTCRRPATWPCGVGACPACGARVALNWNVHATAPKRAVERPTRS